MLCKLTERSSTEPQACYLGSVQTTDRLSMTLRTFALAATLLASACGNADMATAKDLKDRMCACKDKACAARVEAEMDKWNKEMEAKYKDPKEVPDELMTTMAGILQCQVAAEAGTNAP